MRQDRDPNKISSRDRDRDRNGIPLFNSHNPSRSRARPSFCPVGIGIGTGIGTVPPDPKIRHRSKILTRTRHECVHMLFEDSDPLLLNLSKILLSTPGESLRQSNPHEIRSDSFTCRDHWFFVLGE